MRWYIRSFDPGSYLLRTLGRDSLTMYLDPLGLSIGLPLGHEDLVNFVRLTFVALKGPSFLTGLSLGPQRREPQEYLGKK